MLPVGVLEGITCGSVLCSFIFTSFQQELLVLVLFFPSFFHYPQYCILGQGYNLPIQQEKYLFRKEGYIFMKLNNWFLWYLASTRASAKGWAELPGGVQGAAGQ